MVLYPRNSISSISCTAWCVTLNFTVFVIIRRMGYYKGRSGDSTCMRVSMIVPQRCDIKGYVVCSDG